MSSTTTSQQTVDLVRAVQGALSRGDGRTALRLAQEGEAAHPGDPDVKLQKALALRVMGDLAGAVAAIDDALAIEPYHYVALLSKASLIERLSGPRAAAPHYNNALTAAPGELPPALKAPTEHGRQLLQRVNAELEAHVRARTSQVKADLPAAARGRFEESIGIFSGRARAYVQQPLLLHYPRLPAIPFYEREHFPWLPDLEAATDDIRGELEGALAAAQDDFAPYIQYPRGAPVNQWGELNHNRRWSSFFLWRDGVRQEAACKLCPKTAAVLDAIPMARQPGFAPTAMFSALDAHTHIPPHTGSTNVRLLCHLPLVLPGPARFRVGGETREWKIGQAWVFDDTIEHEAWNDADQLRVILIFDVWNPLLDEGERELVNAMLAAKKEFFGLDG